MTTIKQVNKAIDILRAFCQERNCDECPFDLGNEQCSLIEDTPFAWSNITDEDDI